LLRFVTAPEQQTLEARQGSTPVRRSVIEAQRAEASPIDALRMNLLSASIEQHLIVPPKLAFLSANRRHPVALRPRRDDRRVGRASHAR
jgi:hypothetical protein